MLSKMKRSQIVYIRAIIVFLVAFLIINGFAHYQLLQRKEEKQNEAIYAAETTIRRMESQMDVYLTKSDFFKRLIESGYPIDSEQFDALALSLWEDDGVLMAIEIAPGGVVTQVYPKEGNEEAFGLDLLENEERQGYAELARQSGRYTIAGPFELVQGGMGALLFDPIYITADSGERQFWGYLLLVINWDNFIAKLELDKLEEASYSYHIWKRDITTGEYVTIAQAENLALVENLEVVYEVPNDTWHFDIAPTKGWMSGMQMLLDSMLCMGLSFMLALVYWQFEMRHVKDEQYAEEIERSAEKAKAANAAKTRFLFNMSHDIRTPMNAIMGFSELLEEHIDEREKALDYIAKIRTSSDFLLSLINHVLEMARIESGKETLSAEVCDIREMVDSLGAVFEPSCREKRLTFACHADIRHDHILCDDTKMREVLINIVGNSVKYTPDGGKIMLDLTEIPAEKPEYAAYRIVVQDTGVGMSADYLPHIFEEFTRERSSTESSVVGSGLGLPIVKALLDLMRGTIEVESAVGKGTKTTIVVAFPIADKQKIEQRRTRRKEELIQKMNGKRILIAEDNDLNAEIAMTVLSENGLLCERAEDGEVCVRVLTEKPAGYYDAILMDIQMPRLDGYQATEKIRAMRDARKDILIIAMTANAFEEDKQKAFAAGMNAYIPKPISVENVISTLGEVL